MPGQRVQRRRAFGIPSAALTAGERPESGAPRAAGVADALAVAGLLLLVVLIGAVVRWMPPDFDSRIAASLVLACPPWLGAVGDLIGSLPVIGAIGTALLVSSFWRRRWRDAVAVAVGLASEIPTEVVKVVIDRPRPPTAHEIEALGSVASYPSGHVVRTVVVGGLVVALLFGRSRPLRLAATIGAGVVSGLVGFARVGAGAHWPTDVIGGIVLGSAWLAVARVDDLPAASGRLRNEVRSPARRAPRCGDRSSAARRVTRKEPSRTP